MCEHKNLRTVGDRLFCKDCKEELPIEFLLNQCKPEEPVAEEPAAEEPAAEEPSEVIEEGNLEAEEILEDKIAKEIEKQEEPAQEAPQEDGEQGQTPADDVQTDKPAPKAAKAKTARKTAKKKGEE